MNRIFFSLLALFASVCSFASCGNNTSGAKEPTNQPETKSNMENQSIGKKVLVAFFSHTGENYGVGNVTVGNTHRLAQIIATKTGGKLFEIATVKKYPTSYDACTEEAEEELQQNARLELKDDIDVEDFDIIYLGYPIWWGDMPMAVYSFIEKHSWEGKTVIPFCTHEGSGLSSTESNIRKACKGATVGKGLAMRGTVAQKAGEETKKAVDDWIK